MTVENNQRWATLGLLERPDGALDPADIIGVAHPHYIPPVGQKPGGDVFGKRDVGVAFDRDVVVVVDPAEIVEPEVRGQRRRFGRHAFHEAAIAADRIDVVAENVVPRLVVAVRQPLLGDRHPDPGCDPLPERSRRRLHPGNPVILGVTRCAAVNLAEAADVVQGDRRLAQVFILGIHGLGPGQMKNGPEEHGGVTVGQDKPVAVGPDWILGIELHDAIPERVDERRQSHRRAGMSRFGLLDGVDGKRPNCIDGELGDCLVRFWFFKS